MKMITPDQAIKEFYQLHFREQVLDSSKWLYTSHLLLQASKLIFHGFKTKVKHNTREANNLINIYFLLIGLAIENHFKGLIVKRLDHNTVALYIKNKFKDHNLIEYAKQAEFTLSQEDEKLFYYLSIYVTWAGRYPVPKDPYKLFKTSDVNKVKKYLSPKKVSNIVDRIF